MWEPVAIEHELQSNIRSEAEMLRPDRGSLVRQKTADYRLCPFIDCQLGSLHFLISHWRLGREAV